MMNKLSIDSIKILDYLSNFKRPSIKINIVLKNIYKNTVKKYKTISSSSTILNMLCIRKNIKPQNDCIIVRLIKHLYPHPQFRKYLTRTMNTVELQNFEYFVSIIGSLSPKQCELWINKNGKTLMSNFNYIISFKKIPLSLDAVNLDGDIMDIYNPFCSLDIQHEIESKHSKICSYRSDINNFRTALEFHSTKTPSKKMIVGISNNVLLMLLLSNSTSSAQLKLYLTSKKKMLPTDKTEHFLGPREINTGSTLLGMNSKITIWRKEEINKLVLHEMFHLLGMDNGLRHIKNINLHVFNISQTENILLQEAYTETFANIINCITVSSHLGDSLSVFKKLLNYERLFSCFQIAKLLHFYGYERYEDFFNLSGVFHTEAKWTQSTSVFSYFVIKGAFLYSVNSFIEFCATYNKKNIFHFESSKESHLAFNKLILSCCDSPMFKKQVNFFIEHLRKHSNRRNLIYKTLRMTAVELS